MSTAQRTTYLNPLGPKQPDRDIFLIRKCLVLTNVHELPKFRS